MGKIKKSGGAADIQARSKRAAKNNIKPSKAAQERHEVAAAAAAERKERNCQININDKWRTIYMHNEEEMMVPSS